MMGVIIVLSFILVFYVTTFTKLNAVPDRLQIEQLCSALSVKIGAANQFGDGFSENITMPLTMEASASYNITVYTTSLVCRSKQDIIKPHTAAAIRNATSGPPFLLPKGTTLVIRNSAGTVVIS